MLRYILIFMKMEHAVSKLPVLIVGAGPTGLTLACDLARRGVDFRIIDKTTKYFAGSRGKGLQPRSLEILEDLGVVEKILANGRFHLPFRGYDGATVLGDFDMHEGRHPTPDVPYASSMIIPQWRVEEILRGCMEEWGKRVELATELVALEQDADAVTATLQKEGRQEQVRAEYAVAADGGRSFVRKHLNVGFEGETWKDERMLVGDVHVEGLDRDHWHSWPKHKDGWVALCPLPSTDTFQFQAQIPPEEEVESSLETFQRIIDERTRDEKTGRSEVKLSDPTWLSLYRVNVRMVDQYRMGRIFLAGDAAHVHSPAGGQGMNTGIQDAYNLGWKLSAVLHGADASLLDSYEEERLPIAASVLGITSKLHRQRLRNDEKPERGPETLQLGLNYRDCSLSREEAMPATPLRAGDRAPDAPMRDAAGKEVRLFDLFRGPRCTLLSFGNHDFAGLKKLSEKYGQQVCAYTVDSMVSAAHAGDRALTDDRGHARDAYGGENGALFLIRPDGYIGCIGSSQSMDAVENYLEQIYGEI
ncbi:MAG TPA: FAD-dependent oxidoreductase [Acidobacteriaceae bacterium]|nr:FAD-dependent oxidoreductase [Acidobacteriaceae bacterium]